MRDALFLLTSVILIFIALLTGDYFNFFFPPKIITETVTIEKTDTLTIVQKPDIVYIHPDTLTKIRWIDSVIVRDSTVYDTIQAIPVAIADTSFAFKKDDPLYNFNAKVGLTTRYYYPPLNYFQYKANLYDVRISLKRIKPKPWYWSWSRNDIYRATALIIGYNTIKNIAFSKRNK